MLIILLDAVYLMSLYLCIDILFNEVISSVIHLFEICIKNLIDIILRMSGLGGGSNNPSPNPNPSPGPNPPSGPNPPQIPTFSNSNSNDSRKYRPSGQQLERELDKLSKGCEDLIRVGNNHDRIIHLNTIYTEFRDNYFKWLPAEAKKKVNDIESDYRKKGLNEGSLSNATSVRKYWEMVIQDTRNVYQAKLKVVIIFEENSKRIKEKNLSVEAGKAFTEELKEIKDDYGSLYKKKKFYHLKTIREVC